MIELVGRDGDLRRVEELLQAGRDRVVTVTGPAGVGKSRLVAELTARARAAGSRPVTTVFLGTLGRCTEASPGEESGGGGWRHPGGVLPEAARAGRPGTGLLVVDDIDLTAAGRLWLTRILENSPGWRALVAAPTPLGMPGERAFRLAGLAVPEAAALFVSAAAHAGEHVRDDDAVARLCVELDGLPLAVIAAAELAVVVPPRHLLNRLSQARLLDVLGAAAATGCTPLRAATERTWRSLDRADQALSARLSVLPATFPLSAAVAVSGRADESEVLAGCARLAAAGVLTRRAWGEGEPRFALGRALRELGREHVGDLRHAVAISAAHYRRIAVDARARYDSGDESGALVVVEREWAALRESGEYLAADQDPAAALEIAVAAAAVPLSRWYDPPAAGRIDRLRAAAEQAGAGTPALHAEAAVWAARLAVEHATDLPAPDGPLVEAALDAVTAAQRTGNSQVIALAIGFAVETLLAAGETERSRTLVEQAPSGGLAGVWRYRFEAWAAAAAAGTEAAGDRLARARERVPGADGCRAVVAAAAAIDDAAPAAPRRDALPAAERLLGAARALGDRHLEIRLLARLARAEFERGRVAAAARRAGEALQWLEVLGGAQVGAGCAGALTVLVDCAAACGEPMAAARLHEVVSALAPRARDAALGHDVDGYRARVASLRESLGAARYRVAAREAARWELADAVRAGQSLVAARWSEAPDGAELVPPATFGGSQFPSLTGREQEVLAYLAGGVTNKAIASALGLSPKTVMHYSGSIYRKLGAQSRAEAAALAVQHGLLQQNG